MPAALPNVETKYSEPADFPLAWRLDTSKRTAYGDTAPEIAVGTKNRSPDARSDP